MARFRDAESHLGRNGSPADTRFDRNWTLQAPSPTDPLRIERCAQHTRLTRDEPTSTTDPGNPLGGRSRVAISLLD